MTVKSNLNIVALLSIGAILLLYAFVWHTTFQISNQLERIDKIDEFAQTASELNIITEQYLAYTEKRHLETWNHLYQDLITQKNKIDEFSQQDAVSNALPSIKKAFDLIREIRLNPGTFPDEVRRNRLLTRAQTRIRSDIQMLLSISNKIAENRREAVRELQVNQRIEFLLILVPAMFFIIYFVYKLRKRIINALNNLLEGTQRIADGNLDIKIDVEGSDEHSTLAEEFNRMAAILKNYINREQGLRRKAEENLKRWEKLVEQDPNLIMIHVDGEVKFINSAGLEIIGAKNPDQIKGTSIYEFIKDESQRQKAHKRVDQVQQKKQKASPEIYRIKTLDGKERFLQIESMPIKYRGKNATQTVGHDITDYITYEDELQESLNEKTMLLHEIHHRVKNNLAIITGMMELQAMDSKNEALKAQLHESKMRVHSLALVHELMYKSESFSKLAFDEHIRQLVSIILERKNGRRDLEIEYNLDDITLNINQAIPCGLIINELVTNSLKHAFSGRRKGKLKISMKGTKDNINITISDNGSGLPEGLDIHNPDSLGMQLVKILSKQLNASIEYQSNGGSTFLVKFKKAIVKGIGSHHLN